jgi:hypothetical protein
MPSIGYQPAPADFQIKEAGKETFELMGKKYECTIHTFEYTTTKGHITGKMWNTTAIPGNSAKMEIKIEGKNAGDGTTTVVSIVEK